MKNLRESLVFEGLERVRALNSQPLGPKSHAQEGSVKMTSNRAAGEVRTFILDLLDDFIAKVADS